MVHSIEPLFPFDLVKVTFLVPVPKTDPISSTTLIAWQAQQLQKCLEGVDTIRECVLLSRFASLRQFEMQFKNWIRDSNYEPGDLVLVRNTRIEKS